LFHAGKTTTPELFHVSEKTRPGNYSWIGCWRAVFSVGSGRAGPPWKVLPGTLKSRSAPKYFLLESRRALKSSNWDVEEQASIEIFLVGKQASPENLLGMLKKRVSPEKYFLLESRPALKKLYLGFWRAGQPRNISCWKASQPWKALPGMLKSRPALKNSTWDVEEQASLEK
jgi:hypothetical protein